MEDDAYRQLKRSMTRVLVILACGGMLLGLGQWARQRRASDAAVRSASGDGVQGKSIPPGELPEPNPVLGTFPEWSGSPLPLKSTNAELTCSMLTLWSGVGPVASLRLRPDDGLELAIGKAPASEASRAVAAFCFEILGVRQTNWTIGSVALEDQTGNRAETLSASTSQLQGVILHCLEPALWPREPWRIVVWAKRTENAPFAAGELIEFNQIQVPAAPGTNPVRRATARSGLEISLEELVRQPLLVDKRTDSQLAMSYLKVSASALPEGQYLDLVSVIDEQERTLELAESSTSRDRPLEMVFHLREIPEGVRTIDVRLALHHGRRFEFSASPAPAPNDGMTVSLY